MRLTQGRVGMHDRVADLLGFADLPMPGGWFELR